LQQSVDAEPGIVVTAAERLDGRYRLRGFRDPMARSPTELLAGLGNPPAELAFEPFLSLEPEIVEERFRRLTGAPPGAVVEFSGGTLKLSGEAPRGWLERAVSAASTLPGVGRVDTSEIDARTREMARVTGELESLTVPFAKGSSRLTEESAPRIEQAAALIERLGVLSKELGRGTCVTVLGDSAFPDGRQVNARLAALRAFTVVAALREANPRIDEGMVRAWARNVSDSWRPHQRTARFDVRSATSPQRPCAEGGAG
jgi:OOP family OmpA-OmpF porin